ncbi:FkbM family methyltransferase [Umezawaea sp.]|uniref:FkbM family methyltransferase n=1 Tax=Umezawaea sp. TaxID=1955258 RepID=UPI002ED0E026
MPFDSARLRTRRLRDHLVDDGIRLLARTGRWVEPELLGLRGLIAPGDVCLDVGAALGLYTAEFSRLAGPTGRVHSVEPLPFAHALPSRLLGLRDLPGTTWHRVALGARAGTSTMSVPLRRGVFVTGRSFVTDGANGLGSNDEFEDQVEFTVETDTLDGFCARHGIDRVDFLKADVEGAELDVLSGGEGVLEKHTPTVLLEIEARHLRRFDRSPESVVDWMADRGYRAFVWHGSAWREVRQADDRFRNYLFSVREPGQRPPTVSTSFE